MQKIYVGGRKLLEFNYKLNKISRRLGPGARLILIVSLHIFIIALNGYIAYYGTNSLRMDAKIINYGGIIRGGMQKVSKLESNDINAQKDINKIDAIFTEFLETSRKTITNGNMGAFLDQLQRLEGEWAILKQDIDNYRVSKSEHDKQIIVEQSERCWEVANQTVTLAQALSEAKLSMFHIMFIVFFFDFLLIVAIIWLINSIVRHNLEKSSRIDPLTGVCNRHVFNEELYSEITRSQRYGYEFSLLIFDIDFFKQINDTYGHDVGDRILCKMCDLISSTVRKSDLFCRIGGEEFVVIATETDLDNATILAEKLRSEVEGFDFEIAQKLTISVGVTSWRVSDNKDTIFKRADAALYASKSNGRNMVTLA